VVRVKALPTVEHTVEADGLGELLRLAEQRSRVVLQSGNEYGVVAGGIMFRATE
jgi:hypothetical protein